MSNYLYSYGFGENVVQQFLEKYARGCTFLERTSGYSHEYIGKYLIGLVRSRNQLQWESMKRMIKSVEHEEYVDYVKLSKSERRKYLTYVKWEAQDSVLDDEILRKTY